MISIIKVQNKTQHPKAPYGVVWYGIWSDKRHEQFFHTIDEQNLFYDQKHRQLQQEYDIKNREHTADSKLDTYTVNDILDYYLTTLSENTVETITGSLSLLRKMFGSKLAIELTRDNIKDFVSCSKVRNLATTTIYHRFSMLRCALRKAHLNDMISFNPVDGMTIERGYSKVNELPTLDELERMINVSPDHLQRAIILAFYTGARVGKSELFKIKWSDVDLDSRTITIHAAKKNRNITIRHIPIRDDLIPTLWSWKYRDTSEYKDQAEYVIHYKGSKVDNITSSWKNALKKAKITKHFRPYDLRHAFATYTIAYGADVSSVAKVMGHQNTNTIMRVYLHNSKKLSESVIQKIPGNIAGKIKMPDIE